MPRKLFTSESTDINREGRPQGSMNKHTRLIKEAFGMLLQDNLDNLALWLTQVAEKDPKAALEVVMRMSERFVPKLSQQAITDAEGGDIFKNVSFNFGPPIDSTLRLQDPRDYDDYQDEDEGFDINNLDRS